MWWTGALLAGLSCGTVACSGAVSQLPDRTDTWLGGVDTDAVDTDAADTDDTLDTEDVGPASGVRLNEILASNTDGLQDPVDGAFVDWLELHAQGGAVDVSGWTIADAGASLELPAGTTLPAGGFLVILCDDQPEDGALHAGFKLGKDGDSVTIRDAAGRIVDTVSWIDGGVPPLDAQTDDTSLARDARGCWYRDATPTPGGDNR